jgi:hypothetical protein
MCDAIINQPGRIAHRQTEVVSQIKFAIPVHWRPNAAPQIPTLDLRGYIGKYGSQPAWRPDQEW